MLAIFNTIGQLVGGLCRDHTIAKGLSLKFATSGGLELEAQWAGRQSEGLVTAFALHYSWVYRRKGSVHKIDVGAACGGLELFCIQCVVSLGPVGRKNVRCCVLSDYACLLAQSLPVAGSGFTALYTASTWGGGGGGQSYSVSSALYRSVRLAEETSDVAFYRTTRVCSRSLSSAGSGWVE